MLRPLLAGALALAALPALAQTVTVEDAYARSSNPKVGAVFMTLRNAADAPARLVAARSPAAARAELHDHVMEDGIARMREVPAIEIPAGGETRLERGGLHVMLMGLVAPLADGETTPVTLVFENGAEIAIEAPVDNARGQPGGHGAMRHGGGAGMGHGHGQGGTGQGMGMGRAAPAD